MSLRASPNVRELVENDGKLRPRPGIGWVWHILYILYSLEVGVFLLFLPWLGIWDNNYLLYRYPTIRPIVANSFLKGAVLGLGIVNIMIGIQEVVQFRRSLRTHFSR
jgi:hypothetical protein